jgi:hypothetical protein
VQQKTDPFLEKKKENEAKLAFMKIAEDLKKKESFVPVKPVVTGRSISPTSVSLSSLSPNKDGKKPTKDGMSSLKEALSSVISKSKSEEHKEDNRPKTHQHSKSPEPKKEDSSNQEKKSHSPKEVPEEILRNILKVNE